MKTGRALWCGLLFFLGVSMVKKSYYFESLRRFSRRAASGIIAIILVMTVFTTWISADVEQPPINLPPLEEVNCASYIVVNRSTGAVIISKDEDKRIYPASMTKVMTVALALEYLNPQDYVTVSQTAMDATTPNSTMMGLQVGEEVQISELLYGAMLPSGNDAANVLGEAVAAKGLEQSCVVLPTPSEPDTSQTGETETPVPPSLLTVFSLMMNNKAAELGLLNTNFTNTNGLHNDNHYTTASDLAVIMDYALSFEDFVTVINTPTHVFKATNKHTYDGWSIARNTNYLLNDPWVLGKDTKVAQVVGGKTGTTIVAGTGMAAYSINKNGSEMITIVCGIPYDVSKKQTVFVASVMDAGAQECFNQDPVVRVSGNVMDYRPCNAPIGFEAEGVVGTTAPEPEVTPDTQVEPTKIQESVNTDTTRKDNNKEEDENFFDKHPIASIIGLVVIVFIIAVVFLIIIPAVVHRKRKKRSGRSSHDGIRRI